MFLLRYIYILALVVWLGGLVVAGAIVAPTVFQVLQDANIADGRVVAGALFGEVLRQVHVLGYATGILMLLALTGQRLLGPRPVSYGIRATVIGMMLGVTLVSGYAINPRAQAIARAAIVPIAALPLGDARREDFYRLHGWSNLLLALTVAGGLALLWWEARE